MGRAVVWLMLGAVLPISAGQELLSFQLNQPSPAASKTGKSKASAGKPIEITPEREAAALAFVKEHHAELAEILIHLKETSSKEYERAIRDLHRATDRLSQIRSRDPDLYQLELSQWKARSRAQLLTARLHMSDDEALRAQLRSALEEEYDLRLQILTRERDRFAERVSNLEKQIERLANRRAEAIESQFKQLSSRSRKADAKAKGQAKKKPTKPKQTD